VMIALLWQGGQLTWKMWPSVTPYLVTSESHRCMKKTGHSPSRLCQSYVSQSEPPFATPCSAGYGWSLNAEVRFVM
jgi:hypothetical protein